MEEELEREVKTHNEIGRSPGSKRTQFAKGGTGGPGRGKKKPKPGIGAQLAKDMEYAYSNAEKPDDSPGIKAARALAHEDYPKFLAMYVKLIGKEPGQAMEVEEEPEVTAAAKAGAKEERIEDLCDRLLGEWEKEDAS